LFWCGYTTLLELILSKILEKEKLCRVTRGQAGGQNLFLQVIKRTFDFLQFLGRDFSIIPSSKSISLIVQFHHIVYSSFRASTLILLPLQKGNLHLNPPPPRSGGGGLRRGRGNNQSG